MKNLYPYALAVALAPAGHVLAQTAPAPLAGVIVVSGSRVDHDSFDLPAAIDVLDAARIRDGQLRVNLSEVLSAIPGLVAQNRQNYAQDLQISSRGFGARSAFGVRGVRLLTDGIPASMPDGQGQAATFNLDMAERIEVLRGPFSAIYGNHAGGAIQLFTREGDGRPKLELGLAAGSDNTRKTDINAQGKSAGIGYVFDTSRFETDGYRSHSAATRDQSFAKLTLAPSAGGKLTLVAGSLRQDDTQDPLGVTWATVQRDPRAGEIDATDTINPKRTLADRYNTRKSIRHQQAGITFEQRSGDDRLRLMVYGGDRHVIQYQAFSKFVQAPASQSGGVVDFDRRFHGADLQWSSVRRLADGKLTSTVGIDSSRSTDQRTGYENFIGADFGLQGKPRRDEEDLLASVDPYAQAEWQSGAWVLTAGLRRSQLKVRVRDRFLLNGDDSGSVSYSHTTPVLAALYKVAPALNVYASAAQGFEAPTLNELFYSNAGAGFNFKLAPARSNHMELGAKVLAGGSTRINAALFQVKTSDELVVDTASGGRTSYRNAGKTTRQGGELSLESDLGGGIGARVALTSLRAVYSQAFGSVREGSRLPGVPRAYLFGDLAWRNGDGSLSAALEAIASSKVYAEDSNIEIPAPGYALTNLRLQTRHVFNRWLLKAYVRVNNLTDRKYIGSVIVGDANKRYYEAAPGRTFMAGTSVQYTF